MGGDDLVNLIERWGAAQTPRKSLRAISALAGLAPGTIPQWRSRDGKPGSRPTIEALAKVARIIERPLAELQAYLGFSNQASEPIFPPEMLVHMLEYLQSLSPARREKFVRMWPQMLDDPQLRGSFEEWLRHNLNDRLE